SWLGFQMIHSADSMVGVETSSAAAVATPPAMTVMVRHAETANFLVVGLMVVGIASPLSFR
ncbi:MAG: hypothetical protein L0J86_08970, partial [Corynebacterium sp.]|nr:hypothetical protein [Corynebacterium sp.]